VAAFVKWRSNFCYQKPETMFQSLSGLINPGNEGLKKQNKTKKKKKTQKNKTVPTVANSEGKTYCGHRVGVSPVPLTV
jgi:hypothetical protein